MATVDELYSPLDADELRSLNMLLARASWCMSQLDTLRESERGSRALDALLTIVRVDEKYPGAELERALRVLEREAEGARERQSEEIQRGFGVEVAPRKRAKVVRLTDGRD